MLENYSIRDCNLHSKSISDLKWNQDGSYLGCAGTDKAVRIHSFDSSGLRTIQNINCAVPSVQMCWHPNNSSRYAVISSDKNVELYDVRDSQVSLKIPTLGSNLYVSWSPDGKYIAVGNKYDNLTVYDALSGKLVKKHKFEYEVNEFSWTANSDYILVATGRPEGGTVDIMHFDYESNPNNQLNCLDSLQAHTSNGYCLKIDPAYNRFAVGSADMLVSMWNLNDMSCYGTLGTFDSPIRNLGFNGTGKFLAASAESNNLCIFDVDKMEVVATINCKSQLNSLAWHPNRSVLAIAVDAKTINMSEMTSRERDAIKYLKLITFEL